MTNLRKIYLREVGVKKYGLFNEAGNKLSPACYFDTPRDATNWAWQWVSSWVDIDLIITIGDGDDNN